jgi:hypothetical protein
MQTAMNTERKSTNIYIYERWNGIAGHRLLAVNCFYLLFQQCQIDLSNVSGVPQLQQNQGYSPGLFTKKFRREQGEGEKATEGYL